MGKDLTQRSHKRLIEQRRDGNMVQPRSTTHPQRRMRQAAAKERMQAWRALTIEQQLNELSLRPGHSVRQKARLEELDRQGFRFIPEPGERKEQQRVAKQIANSTTEEKGQTQPLTKAPPKTDIKALKAWKKKHTREAN